MPLASIRIRVPFVDVDASQRIHYTAWFRYMEAAEHQLMRDLGVPYATASILRGYGFPRVHLEADFHGAIGFDDVLVVEAWVARVGTSSWTIAVAGRHAPDAPKAEPGVEQQPLATGRLTVVCMDPKTQRATPLTAELREALSQA
jgi:acyl-CoA thioester hydrolase